MDRARVQAAPGQEGQQEGEARGGGEPEALRAARERCVFPRTRAALTRDAFFKLDGHDEVFYAWGGEDNYFLDCARTLKFVEGAFLPMFHLWQPEAPNRSGDRNAALLAGRPALPDRRADP